MVSTGYSKSIPVPPTIEMAPISEEERNAINQEVEEALERTTIDKDNLKVYMKISTKGKEVAWMPIMCKRCGRPLYVHAEECTARVRMAKHKATLHHRHDQ